MTTTSQAPSPPGLEHPNQYPEKLGHHHIGRLINQVTKMDTRHTDVPIHGSDKGGSCGDPIKQHLQRLLWPLPRQEAKAAISSDQGPLCEICESLVPVLISPLKLEAFSHVGGIGNTGKNSFSLDVPAGQTKGAHMKTQ